MKKEPFLYLASFILDGCFALTGLCVPLLAMRLGATYDDLGALGAVGAFIYSLSCLASGRLSDRMGYRRSLTAASLMVVIVFSCYPFVTRVAHIFILSGVTGLVISNFWPPLQAWLGKGKDRRSLLRALGGFNVAWSLGFLIGPALGGQIYEVNPNQVFFLGAGLVAVLFLALLFLNVRESQPAETAAETVHSFPTSRLFLPVAWVANFATFFSIGTVRSLFPKLATDLGIQPGTLGHLMSLIGLAQLAAFFLISRTDRWQFRLSPLVMTQLLAIAGLFAFVFGATPGVFVLGLLSQGALAGVTFTASIFYSLYAEGAGGRRTGFHESIVGSGFLIGPLAGGFAAEYLGPRSPYLLAAMAILCAIVFQTYLLNKKSARELRSQAAR